MLSMTKTFTNVDENNFNMLQDVSVSVSVIELWDVVTFNNTTTLQEHKYHLNQLQYWVGLWNHK